MLMPEIRVRAKAILFVMDGEKHSKNKWWQYSTERIVGNVVELF